MEAVHSLERPEYAKLTPEQMQEHLAYFDRHRDELIEKAALARDNAVSHRKERPFKVGCAVLAWFPSMDGQSGEYKEFSGHNFKPKDIPVEGVYKRCAERNAIGAAQAGHPYPIIIGIVTVSRETNTSRVVRGLDVDQADDALHPCPDCHVMLDDLVARGILRPDSKICNVNDAKKFVDGKPRVIEDRSAKELLHLLSAETAAQLRSSAA